MKMLFYLYRQSWLGFSVATCTGLLGGFSGAGLVAVVSKGVADKAHLLSYASLFFGLCIFQLLNKACSEITLVRLTQEMVCQLRIDLSRKLLATPYNVLEGMGKPRLLAILTGDVNMFTQAAQLLPAVFGNCIVTIVCLGYMAFLSWPIFLSSTLFLAFGVTAYHFSEQRPLRQMRKVRGQMDIIYRNFRSLLEGTRELKLNSARSVYFIDNVIAPSAQNFRKLFVRTMTGYTIVNNMGSSYFFIALGVALFVIPVWAPQPAATMTAITFLLFYLIQPVSSVMGALPNLRQSSIALSRIRQLNADLTQIAPEAPHQHRHDPFAVAYPDTPLLQLIQVRHQFPGLTDDKPFNLGPIDLSIQRGETLFIVGGNGSGKTTLAMLLLGLYKPEGGAIKLNGVQVDDVSRSRYRQYFSAVFADFFLFDEILGADEQRLAAQANEYLSKLRIGHKVKAEAGRYSTTSLSQGQRKRMALVSSYLEDRPIHLFDEWAADQDPVFKRIFYLELLPELKKCGKTVIVISHDDAYFSCADCVIKLEDGMVVSDL
ncbi:MAG: cyclic peptide export ABC transporter [Methylocella sp.]